MRYRVVRTKQYERDVRHVKKMGRYDLRRLDAVIDILAAGKQLHPQHRDHKLQGKYRAFKECRIESDWLLVYRHDEDRLILFLIRTGRHTDLFEE